MATRPAPSSEILVRLREVQSADPIVLNWEKNAPHSIPSIVTASLGDLLDCAAIEFDPFRPVRPVAGPSEASPDGRSGARRFAVAYSAPPVKPFFDVREYRTRSHPLATFAKATAWNTSI